MGMFRKRDRVRHIKTGMLGTVTGTFIAHLGESQFMLFTIDWDATAVGIPLGWKCERTGSNVPGYKLRELAKIPTTVKET